MGGNKNGKSGNDPRGRMQNESADVRDRYYSQQGPLANQASYNYGRASEANYGDYTDIMNQYRSIASGGGQAGEGGGGGGGGGGAVGNFDAFTVSPGRAGYSDPFASYGGMQEFASTGGYSANDIANMRARGVSPIRAAYANAEREVGRQRSLQGGYAPNAIAAQVKMAREQGQAAADATQNVEAGLAEARNRGRQFGLTGMGNIEGQRLSADVDLSKFNTGLDFQGQQYNADAYARAQAAANAAAESGANRGAASAAANNTDRLRALSGMTQLYGTSPGMAETFGNQLLQGVGQGGTYGLNMMGRRAEGQQLPGAWERGMQRGNDVMDWVNTGTGVANAFLSNRRRPQQPSRGPSNVWEEGGGG